MQETQEEARETDADLIVHVGDLVRHPVCDVGAGRRARVGTHYHASIVLHRHDCCLHARTFETLSELCDAHVHAHRHATPRRQAEVSAFGAPRAQERRDSGAWIHRAGRAAARELASFQQAEEHCRRAAILGLSISSPRAPGPARPCLARESSTEPTPSRSATPHARHARLKSTPVRFRNSLPKPQAVKAKRHGESLGCYRGMRWWRVVFRVRALLVRRGDGWFWVVAVRSDCVPEIPYGHGSLTPARKRSK